MRPLVVGWQPFASKSRLRRSRLGPGRSAQFSGSPPHPSLTADPGFRAGISPELPVNKDFWQTPEIFDVFSNGDLRKSLASPIFVLLILNLNSN
jgi:hypothetical protein